MLKVVRTLAILVAMASPAAHADWHGGKVSAFKIAYDGQTITFNIAGYARTNCTCYAGWGSDLCLDRSRDSFKEEVAMLLSARARGTDIAVHINETTCFVNAIYEID